MNSVLATRLQYRSLAAPLGFSCRPNLSGQNRIAVIEHRSLEFSHLPSWLPENTPHEEPIQGYLAALDGSPLFYMDFRMKGFSSGSLEMLSGLLRSSKIASPPAARALEQ